MELFIFALVAALSAAEAPDTAATKPTVGDKPAVAATTPSTEAPKPVAEAPASTTPAVPVGKWSINQIPNEGGSSLLIYQQVATEKKPTLAMACSADKISIFPVTDGFNVPLNNTLEGASVELTFKKGQDVVRRIGRFLKTKSGIKTVRLILDLDADLSQMIKTGGSFTVEADGLAQPLVINMAGGEALVASFFSKCGEYLETTKAPVEAPKPLATEPAPQPTTETPAETPVAEAPTPTVVAEAPKPQTEEAPQPAETEVEAPAWEYIKSEPGDQPQESVLVHASDAGVVTAACVDTRGADAGLVTFSFYAPVGAKKPGDKVTLSLSIDPGLADLKVTEAPETSYNLNAEVAKTEVGDAIVLNQAPDLSIWPALFVSRSITFGLLGGEQKTIPLDEGTRAMALFQNDCLSYAAAAPIAVAKAPATPAQPVAPVEVPAKPTVDPSPSTPASETPAVVTTKPIETPAAADEDVFDPFTRGGDINDVTKAEVPVAVAPSTQPATPVTTAPTIATGPRWIFSRGEFDGKKASFLRFGTPGNQETKYIAACREGDGAISTVGTWYLTNIGENRKGRGARGEIKAKGEKLTSAFLTTFDDGNGYQGFRRMDAYFTSLFKHLAREEKVAFEMAKAPGFELSLAGSTKAVLSFQQDCRDHQEKERAALKAAGKDRPKTRKQDENVVLVIAASLAAESQTGQVGSLASDLPANAPRWSLKRADYKGFPTSVLRFDRPNATHPEFFAACNGSGNSFTSVSIWTKADLGQNASSRFIMTEYSADGGKKARRAMKPFDLGNGYAGITVDRVAYSTELFQMIARGQKLTLESDKLSTAEFSLAASGKAALQFVDDCTQYIREVRAKEKELAEKPPRRLSNITEPMALIAATASESVATLAPSTSVAKAPAAAPIAAVTTQPTTPATAPVKVQPSLFKTATVQNPVQLVCDNGRRVTLAFAQGNAVVDYEGLPPLNLRGVNDNTYSDGFFKLGLKDGNKISLSWTGKARICSAQ